ncbi:MAG: cold shock domain-containing protein [Anaerococcus sp.]|nr:cold shock domain-containing protein [Anaerococcus sp.]
MSKGEVKTFDNKRGFGFIKWEGEDLFVHFSDIESEETYKTLYPGQVVEFEKIEGPRGDQAVHVRIVEK